MTRHLDPQTRRFYDGGPVDGAPDPSAPPVIVLERTSELSTHAFRMTRRIAYRDRELGELLVPADPDAFVTDLASVPTVFAWLVPRTGEHLPAALVHDGLFASRGGDGVSYVGPPGIDAEVANRVFRDALADAGTPLVRRWLMWTAVTLGTMVTGAGASWSRAERWRWRLTAVGTLLFVTLLGVLATADLLDAPVGGVPWMDDGPWWTRLATGAAGAVASPFVLGLAWGRFRVAGVIAGISLALLLHVTAAVALLLGLYRLIEWLVSRAPTVALVLGSGVALVAAVVFVLAW